MPAWEYMLLMCTPRSNHVDTIQGKPSRTNASLTEYLNWFGEQGWEFAGMASDNVGYTTLILKRQKTADE